MKKFALLFITLLLIAAALSGCAKPQETAPLSSSAKPAGSEVSVAPSSGSEASSGAASQASSSSSSSSAAASSKTDAAPAQTKSTPTVTVNIDGSRDTLDGGGKCSFSVSLQSGDSVYAVMQRLSQQKKITLSVEKSIGGVYIQAINNWACGDGPGLQGWIYRVDGGNPPGVGCDKYTALRDGSVIEWQYTPDGNWH